MTLESQAKEISDLKQQLEDKQQELDEMDASFNEFQDFSKQLEEQMEQELKASEKKYADLLSQHRKLKDDNENILEKLGKSLKESSALIASLQDELNKLTQTKISTEKDIRRLEQENDQLERRERVLGTSVADLSERLEKSMEENVYLQNELDEYRSSSSESIQRLRDEIRDITHELEVSRRAQEEPVLLGTTQKLNVKRESTSDLHRPPKSPRRGNLTASNPNSGAAAIAMVADMLDLVKDLEARISGYKHNCSLVTPPQSPRTAPLIRIDSVEHKASGRKLNTSLNLDKVTTGDKPAFNLLLNTEKPETRGAANTTSTTTEPTNNPPTKTENGLHP